MTIGSINEAILWHAGALPSARLRCGGSESFFPNALAQTHPPENITYTHDAYGRLITAADANNNPTDYAYDADGNLIQITDAQGIKTQMRYDALNRLTSISQDSEGIKATTQFDYDVLDQLIKVTDPRGLSTSYNINALGDLQSVSSPDSGTTTYSYLRAVVLGKRVDARGVTTTWDYDKLVRPVLTQWTQGASQIALRATYDVAPAFCGPAERAPIGPPVEHAARSRRADPILLHRLWRGGAKSGNH